MRLGETHYNLMTLVGLQNYPTRPGDTSRARSEAQRPTSGDWPLGRGRPQVLSFSDGISIRDSIIIVPPTNMSPVRRYLEDQFYLGLSVGCHVSGREGSTSILR